jgi:hypothetical protein
MSALEGLFIPVRDSAFLCRLRAFLRSHFPGRPAASQTSAATQFYRSWIPFIIVSIVDLPSRDIDKQLAELARSGHADA